MDADDDVQQPAGASASREYDFSDDFNISEVKDTDDKSEPTPISPTGQLPKSLSEAVDKSLAQISKPGTTSNAQINNSSVVPPPYTPTIPVRKPGASINILEQQVVAQNQPQVKPVTPITAQNPVAPVAQIIPQPIPHPVPPASSQAPTIPVAPVTPTAPAAPTIRTTPPAPAIPREPKPDPKPTPSIPTPSAMRPDPFREPITKLDTEWPFASPETLARHRDREQQPYQMPEKQASAPTNLPIGEVEAPLPTPPVKPNPQIPPSLANYVRPSSTPAVPAPTRPGLATNPVVPQPPRPIQTPPMPSMSPARPAASVPANNTPGAGQHPGGLKNIRTYESDVADALAARPVTKTSMAIAESKKRGEGEVLTSGESVVMPASKPMNIPARVMQQPGITVELEEKSHIGWKLAIILLSLALIGGGVFAGYYLYSQSPLAEVPTTPPVVVKHTPALVPYDTQSVINIDGANNVEILRRINVEIDKPLASSTIREIVFTETKEGQTYRTTAPQFILLAGVPVPDMIARTLNHEWMLGVYAGPGAKHTPFVVVRTNLFQNAFAGMLSWEQSMIRDLQPFLGIPYDQPAPKSSFKDQIVKNKDVRAFVLEDNTTLFEYTFIDNSTLVITGDNSVLSTIITRLESKAFVR